MILFYRKDTGEIVGTIDGRIHDEKHLGMWVGDKEEIDRLVIQWDPVKFYNKEGDRLPKGHKDIYTSDYEPTHEQKELFMDFEKNGNAIYAYKVNLETKLLEKVLL